MSVGSELARQVQADYNLSRPVTEREVLAVYGRLRVAVVFLAGLEAPGYFLSGPDPAAILRPDASLRVLCHEMYHSLTATSDAESTVYAYRAGEADADEFASVLCGSD